MATITIYASSVSGASWTNPNNAAGSPSAGEAAPFATYTGSGSVALTATFPATAIPGTITGFSALLMAEATAGDRYFLFSRAGMTFADAVPFLVSTFSATDDSAASFTAATLKTDIQAGLTGLIATLNAGTSTTIDAKGFGITITYNPDQVLQSSSRDRQRSRGRAC